MINPYQTPALVQEPRSAARRFVQHALYVLIWSALGFFIPYLLRGGFQLAAYAGWQNYEADLESYEWLPAAIACMLVLGLSAGLCRYPRLGIGLFEAFLIVGGSIITSSVVTPLVVEGFGLDPVRTRGANPVDWFASVPFAIWLGIVAILITVSVTVRLVAKKES